MKSKYVILSVVYGILFMIDCYFSNYPIINMKYEQFLTETDIFIALYDSVNGYNGLLEMMVVYTLPFLFGYYYVANKEMSYEIIRYDAREKYKREETKKMIFVAILFMFIHQGIGFVYTVMHFKWSFLSDYSYSLYMIAAGIIAVIFYVQTGFLYQIIRDWLKRDFIALLIVFGINFTQTIAIKYKLVKIWISGKDLFAAFDFLRGKIELGAILFVIVRSILLVICLYMISQIVFEKKDIIKYEK